MNSVEEYNMSMEREAFSSGTRPLITFALFAYNQEKYIREAVEGALAQTYSPLEIILSDDCSSDRTFEIMQEMAAEYDGSHEVILNRTEPNLGLGGHIQRVANMASGEWMVIAAGDDRSYSNRVSVLVEEMTKDVSVRGIISRADWFYKNSQGELIFINDNFPCASKTWSLPDLLHMGEGGLYLLLGASAAWHHSLFKRFPPLDGILHEDAVLGWRALMLGTIAYIPEALVKYRITSREYKPLTFQEFKERERRWSNSFYYSIPELQYITRDLELVMPRLLDAYGEDVVGVAQKWCQQKIALAEYFHNLWNQGCVQRLSSYLRGRYWKYAPYSRRLFLQRVFPMRIFYLLTLLKNLYRSLPPPRKGPISRVRKKSSPPCMTE